MTGIIGTQAHADDVDDLARWRDLLQSGGGRLIAQAANDNVHRDNEIADPEAMAYPVQIERPL